MAKPRAGNLDPLGRLDFLAAREQRNLAHLHQINSHRVVDAVGRTGRLAVDIFQFALSGQFVIGGLEHVVQIGDGFGLVRLGLHFHFQKGLGWFSDFSLDRRGWLGRLASH